MKVHLNFSLMKKITLILLSTIVLSLTTSCKTLFGNPKSDFDDKEYSAKHSIAAESLKDMDFVLEANRLYYRGGKTVIVQSLTNFISSHDGVTVVQVSPRYGGDINGVGGVTVEGRATGLKVSERKNGAVNLSMTVTGPTASATVEIRLDRLTNRARAVISSNFNSDRITIEGVLLPYSEKNIYQGIPL